MTTLRRTLFLLAAGFLMLPPTASSQDYSAEATHSVVVGRVSGSLPQSVSLTSGGSVQVGIGGCSYGYVTNAPDVGLLYNSRSSSSPTLYIYAEGEGDTTLLIWSRGLDGHWVCDDDSYGDGDPMIVLPNAGGVYVIWVGSFNNESHDATLYISETDPRTNTPSGNTPPDNTSSGQVPDYSLEPA